MWKQMLMIAFLITCLFSSSLLGQPEQVYENYRRNPRATRNNHYERVPQDKHYQKVTYGDSTINSLLENTHPLAPEWWYFVRVKTYTFTSKITLKSGFDTPFTRPNVDYTTNDLQLSREEQLFGGEISIGPAPAHLRFSYLTGDYRGKGFAPTLFYFHGTKIAKGTSFTSEVSIQDFSLDVVVGFNSLLKTTIRGGPFGFSLQERAPIPAFSGEASIGVGFFEMDNTLSIGASKITDQMGAPFWHVGIKGSFSPLPFFTVQGGMQVGVLDDEETLDGYILFRTWIGFQVNITRFFSFGVEYRYHVYRADSGGDFSQFELYGTTGYLAFSF